MATCQKIGLKAGGRQKDIVCKGGGGGGGDHSKILPLNVVMTATTMVQNFY